MRDMIQLTATISGNYVQTMTSIQYTATTDNATDSVHVAGIPGGISTEFLSEFPLPS